MASATGSSKDYFEALGADWDRLRETLFSNRVREKALTLAGFGPGSLVADLGAGTGFVTEELLAGGARVIAVDQSPAMLDALRRKFPPPAPVDCRVGDAARLPIGDASVDRCFANMVLHHVDSPRAAIGEMARILKPGGRAVVTDLDRHGFDGLCTEHHDRWPGFERNEIRAWFLRSGLDGVRVVGLDERCCATTADGTEVAIGVFFATGIKP